MNNFTREFIVNEIPKNFGIFGDFSEADNVTYNAYFKLASEGKDGKSVLVFKTTDMPEDTTGLRLSFDIKEVGKNTSEFANALTRNAKSYSIDLDKTATAEDFVKTIESEQKLAGVKLFTISEADGNITVKGDKYTNVENLKLSAICVNEKFTAYSSEVETVLSEGAQTKCENPFGDADYLINNFRLPSLANTNWLALNQDERPIPGVKYNQFTIEKRTVRKDVHGQGAVGQEIVSVTTHVFYVNENVTTEFRGKFGAHITFEPAVEGESLGE